MNAMIGIEFEMQFKDKTHDKLKSKQVLKGFARQPAIQTVYDLLPRAAERLVVQERGYPPAIILKTQGLQNKIARRFLAPLSTIFALSAQS